MATWIHMSSHFKSGYPALQTCTAQSNMVSCQATIATNFVLAEIPSISRNSSRDRRPSTHGRNSFLVTSASLRHRSPRAAVHTGPASKYKVGGSAAAEEPTSSKAAVHPEPRALSPLGPKPAEVQSKKVRALSIRKIFESSKQPSGPSIQK